MQKLCGCLPYYYPAFGTVWNVSTSCNVKGLRCLARKSGMWLLLSHFDCSALHLTIYNLAFLHALEPRAFDDNTTYIKAPHCNCPNDCSETVYSQVPVPKATHEIFLLHEESLHTGNQPS